MLKNPLANARDQHFGTEPRPSGSETFVFFSNLLERSEC